MGSVQKNIYAKKPSRRGRLLFLRKICRQTVFDRRDSQLQLILKVCLLEHIADVEFDRPRIHAEGLCRRRIWEV